jgi:benzoylformate decarboxylase
MDAPRRNTARERLDRQRDAKAAARQKEVAADAVAGQDGALTLAGFAQALAARLPPDALIFDEAITSSPTLMRYLPQEQPGSYFQTRAGMLGTGLPGAVGLKVAHPDGLVVGLIGDGGAISTIQALATAARHKIGAKFIICNNRSYRILKYNLQDYWRTLGLPADAAFPPSFDLDAPALDFAGLAEAQGVRGIRVTRADEIAPALDAGLAQRDEPFLIELVLSPAL